eukprot:TRINITY_DN2171_c1_g1_i5.p1 TRINITY_DN2171_c1_g1~~TRINITY_DN2171_c1_g1_i5.p1  ORF type:complete len:775 (+),score=224.35 TRINITY_DN2171_c1_g1_i5:121-2445(+)
MSVSGNTQYKQLNYDAGQSMMSLMGNKAGGELADLPRRRMYEMCMVFRYKTHKRWRFEEKSDEFYNIRGLDEPDAHDKNKMQMWKQHRESILKSLQNCGLDLYCFYSRDRDEILVKIGASSQKLRDTAARRRYKIQLKKEYLNAYAEFRHDHPGRPEMQFKDRRIISHIYKTHTEDNLDGSGIFKTIDKIYLIDHIIKSKDKDCAGINIGKLLHQDELKAYFPLHEAAALQEIRDDQMQWFLMGEEHANRLRDYFGDKIGFYFIWMSFYVKWLIPLAVVGVFLQFVDILARTPDNLTAIPFCIFMSIWALCFPYFWRRQEAKYAINWGTLDLVDQLEPHRPEHWGEQLINPVTSQVEPYYPWTSRIFDYMLSSAVMIIAACFAVFLVLVILFLRHNMKNDAPLGLLVFQLALAAYVEIANYMLTVIARGLTDRENHRTQKEHDTALLVKIMALKFINGFFCLYYVAFFKSHAYLFGSEMQCLRNDCFLDLQGQLAIFVIFRLVISNTFEYFLPKFNIWWRSCYYDNMSCSSYLHGQSLLEMAEMSLTEQQAKKMKYHNFDNFDEMLLTHGFASLFAVTSPWVLFATLLAVVVEIWIDMTSLIDSKQRPMPFRAKGNEPWTTAFEIYGVLAAFTNVFLLIFSSSQYDSWTLTEKLTLFFFLEHMIFGSWMVIQIIFPPVPRNVDVLQLKQDNLVHRCLEGIKVENTQLDFSMFREQRVQDEVQVFGYDMLEQEEAEMQLSLRDSGNSMYEGVMDEVNLNSLRSTVPIPGLQSNNQ